MKLTISKSLFCLVMTGVVIVWAPMTAEATGPIAASASTDADGDGASAPFAGSGEPEVMPLSLNLRVAGSTLKPRADDVTYQTSGSGGCVYVTGGNQNQVWNIPVLLPQGAVVGTLRIYYDDTSASDSTAWFTIYDLYGAVVDEVSVSTSGTSGNGYRDSASINHQIDYGTYSYVLNWRPIVTGSTMQLCGFRIFYETP